MLALLASFPSVGQTFQDVYGTLNYEVISAEEGTCRVTGVNSSAIATAIIPAEVTHNNVTYKVMEIGDEAFAGCADLTHLETAAADQPIKFGHDALKDVELTTVVLGRDFTCSVNDEPFDNMSSITSLSFGAGVTRIPSFWFHGTKNLKSVRISGKIESIGVAAFDNSGLTSVTIDSQNLTTIGSEAFQGCPLSTVSLPASLKYIGDAAFASTSLSSITIPAGVISIGRNAFSNCTSLGSFTVASGNKTFSSSQGLLYTYGYEKLLQVPANKRPVYFHSNMKEIGEYAFNGCNVLFVNVPEGVTSIGEQAFRNCRKMTSVTLPESLTKVGAGAFYNCTALTTINFPSGLTAIPDEAFLGAGLKTLELPSTITSIGAKAFSICPSLASVTVPGSVTSMGSGVFMNCYKLTSATLGEGIGFITESMFSGCSLLADVTIPQSVAVIENSAFAGCSAIKEVHLPEWLEKIGDNAFNGVNLTGVYSVATKPGTLSASSFSNKTFLAGTLYVPVGLKAVYQAAPVWRLFSNIVESEELSALDGVTADDETAVRVYNLQGVLIYSGEKSDMPALPAGIYLINGRKIYIR